MDDDDDVADGGAGRKNAMPSFEPHHVFNACRVYRDMARFAMRSGSYSLAKDKLDLAVSLSKNPEDQVDSLYLRSKCFDRMLDVKSAVADCEKAQTLKNNPQLDYLRGQLLYKENRFEDALSIFAINCRQKAFPDQFDYSAYMVAGTMQNCVGRNAGSLGKFILELKVKAVQKNKMNSEELKMFNDYMEKKKKVFSEKYLGSLGDDKKMLMDIAQSPPMLGENEEVDIAARQLERATVAKLELSEDAFWQRKPLYCFKHLKIVPSFQRKLELKELQKLKTKLHIADIERQIKKLERYCQAGEWVELYKLAFYLMTRVLAATNEEISCKIEFTTRIVDVLGNMYLQMKTFKKHWSMEWNDKRTITMIGLERPKTTVDDLCKDSFHAPIIDIREKISQYLEFFNLTEDEYLKMYYNFEIACLYSMMGMWREAKSFSKTSIFDARKQTSVVWYINALFVYARSEVQDANYHDAMVTFIAIREACDRFGFKEQEQFFDRLKTCHQAMTVISKEPAVRRVPQVQKSAVIREQQIINLMPDFGLKSQAKNLFSRVSTLEKLLASQIEMSQKPPWKRMMLMKGSAVPISEKTEELDIVAEALEERERMKDEKVAVKKARAQAAAAKEKTKEQTTLAPIKGVDNYMMRKLIEKYRRCPFNVDNFQM